MNQMESAAMATKSIRGAGFSAEARGRLVVFGAGYVGGAFARRALAAGWRVTALTRNPATAAGLRAAGCEVVVAELASADWWDAPALLGGAERVAVTVASGGGGVEGYRRSYVAGLRSVVGWGRFVGAAVDGGGAGHLIYTSSTSVYPQGGGARVTEADEVGCSGETTDLLVEAERIAGEWPGASATVLRLAGIYGPERVHLVEQVRTGEVSGGAETHLNLIHREDILGAMDAVWRRGDGGGATGAGVFNVVEEGGATTGEGVAWLAARLGVAAPRFTGLPAGGRRAVTPDRIIDGGLARSELGWRAGYRSFREGYADVLG